MKPSNPPLIAPPPAAGDAPLTPDECAELEAILAGCSPSAMNIEMLDGFLTALHCGPDRVPPSEYLPQVWGVEPVFSDDDALDRTLRLVMRHGNAVARSLQRALAHDDIVEPRIRTDTDGRPGANDWALGFMRGVRLRPAAWRSLMQGVEGGELLYPVLWLIHEHDDDPALRPPGLSPDERESLVGSMVASLPLIYRHFAPRRAAMSPEPQPVRRAGPKPGRNAPCPCGSGRKFKHCCERGGETLH